MVSSLMQCSMLGPAQRIRSCAFSAGPIRAPLAHARLPPCQALPRTYEEAIAAAQQATRAAVADGVQLLEIEFPTAGLDSVAGDAEGQNEMTYSLEFLRRFLVLFQLGDTAATTRVFFPDKQEMRVAQQGLSEDPNAGRAGLDPVFESTAFQLDYLTEPTGLLDLGIDFKKVKTAERVQPQDTAFVMAYPHFNVNEMIEVAALWDSAIAGTGRPVIIFNGELDRLRSNYYPPFIYPKLAKVGKEFVPLVEAAFYLHNFKGSRPAALCRTYPGPWQLWLKGGAAGEERLVQEFDTRPSLRDVALNILPKLR
eukprot:jgi/Ulvmu1/10627/UM066_0006.1